MKIFRRSVFGLLAVGLLATFAGLMIYKADAPNMVAFSSVAFSAALILWSIMYLRIEPHLTRAALIAVLIAMLAWLVIAWLMAAQAAGRD
jgi:hypothetical protein